ncbi:MbtH family protein [Streptomyces mirabilis]|uniref:MbtH family protein n=1 Tax=Streptomyces mirabilis TaxID=68239 RepID=UPI001BB034CA|nr:MbtH family protein [Streptomyces mirabilis]QUW77781.1 MbtH family protein [Streptomyces mirabilis]
MGTNPFDDERHQFRVVVNDQGRHAIWPDVRDIPRGWRSVTAPGDRQACLDYIGESWTDPRPAEPTTPD